MISEFFQIFRTSLTRASTRFSFTVVVNGALELLETFARNFKCFKRKNTQIHMILRVAEYGYEVEIRFLTVIAVK